MNLICGQSWMAWMLIATAASSSASPTSVHLEKRVVNGQPLTKSLPWLMSMHKPSGDQLCGASLVAPTIAVTAAHCVKKITQANIGGYRLYANRPDISQSTLEQDGVAYRLRAVQIHPKYDSKSNAHDIAVVHLRPTNATKKNMRHLRYIKLDTTNGGRLKRLTSIASTSAQSLSDLVHDLFNGVKTTDPLNKNLFVAGWGDEREDAKQSPSVARYAQLELTKESQCLDDLRATDIPEKSILCAIGKTKRADACQGDSGGPLYTDTGSNQTLVGVVSFGVGCGEARAKWLVLRKALPGVYTSVYQHRKFIRDARRRFEAAERSEEADGVLASRNANAAVGVSSTVSDKESVAMKLASALSPAVLFGNLVNKLTGQPATADTTVTAAAPAA